jgi:perosamine synthetase
MEGNFIPVGQPDLSGNEEKYVVDAIRTSWISSTGPYIDRFEREFATVCDTRFAIGVCNGTAALHLALLTLNVQPGDEVLVPSLTYIATANAVRYVGAEPVFVDCDLQTWCIDPVKIEAAITPRTKGIIVVHLYGHPADMDVINRLAAAHGLWVVEDAAEAPLATYKGRPVGGLATIGTFSFYGNKVLTCGEGGALTINDPDLNARARLLRGQGMDPNRRYYFPVTGYNFRLTNICCALLCAQLERVDQILLRRREIFKLYGEWLASLSGIGFQPVAPFATISPWLFCLVIDESAFGIGRDEVMKRLHQQGIDSRPFFIPLHTMPPFSRESQARKENLPITDGLAASGLNLPTYSRMTNDEVRKVCEAIRQMAAR